MVYIIEDISFEVGEVNTSPTTMFVTDDKNKALNRFKILKSICESSKGDQKYVYWYLLYEWITEETCKIIDECNSL